MFPRIDVLWMSSFLIFLAALSPASLTAPRSHYLQNYYDAYISTQTEWMSDDPELRAVQLAVMCDVKAADIENVLINALNQLSVNISASCAMDMKDQEEGPALQLLIVPV